MSRKRRRGDRRRKIIEGLEEAVRYARSEPTEVRVTTYFVPQRARATVRPDGLVEISRKPVRLS